MHGFGHAIVHVNFQLMILLDNQQFCAAVIILVWKIKLVSLIQSGISIMGIGGHIFRCQCTLLTNLMDLQPKNIGPRVTTL